MPKPSSLEEVVQALKDITWGGMFSLFSPELEVTEEPPGTYNIIIVLHDVPARDPNEVSASPLKYGDLEFKVVTLKSCPIVVTADQLAVPDAPRIFGTWQETLAKKVLDEMLSVYVHEVQEAGRYKGKLINDPHPKEKGKPQEGK